MIFEQYRVKDFSSVCYVVTKLFMRIVIKNLVLVSKDLWTPDLKVVKTKSNNY